ncbi:MAG: hypothetical protein FJ279_21870 [Planctomycetes bacterium]|nr:hypothetical protein [Planctomycetota bacterium]
MKVHLFRRVGFTGLVTCRWMAAVGILVAAPRCASAQPAGIGPPTFKDPSGTCTIKVTRIACARTFGAVTPPSTMEVHVALECHKPVAFYVILPLDEARDNTGQDLLDPQRANRPLYRRPLSGGVESPFPQTGSAVYHLQLPHPDAKTLSFLKGKVLLTECREWAEVVFENPLQTAGAARETKHGRVTLKAMKESPRQVSCELDLTVPTLPPLPKEVEENLPEWMKRTRVPSASYSSMAAPHPIQATLVDTQGRQRESLHMTTPRIGGEGEYGFAWTRDPGGPAPTPPHALKVRVPLKYENVCVAFEMKDIPLP